MLVHAYVNSMGRVSHTATCEREEHAHHHPEPSATTLPPPGAVSDPTRVQMPAAVGGSMALAEVRSAVAATVLFVVAILSGAGGAPRGSSPASTSAAT